MFFAKLIFLSFQIRQETFEIHKEMALKIYSLLVKMLSQFKKKLIDLSIKISF